MDSGWIEWQAMLQLQQTLYLCLIGLLAVSACLMTFVCLLSLWLETSGGFETRSYTQRRPCPRCSSAANPAGSSPAVLRIPERVEEESIKFRIAHLWGRV